MNFSRSGRGTKFCFTTGGAVFTVREFKHGTATLSPSPRYRSTRFRETVIVIRGRAVVRRFDA